MLRPRTSQDFRCGSKKAERASFLEAEKDLVRRSSGRKEAEGGGRREAAAGRNMALSAAAAVEDVGGFREEVAEEEELGSRTARRSQRHEGQKPVKFSVGWRSQEVEGR